MEIRNITPMNTRPAFGMAFKAPDPQDMDNFVKYCLAQKMSAAEAKRGLEKLQKLHAGDAHFDFKYIYEKGAGTFAIVPKSEKAIKMVDDGSIIFSTSRFSDELGANIYDRADRCEVRCAHRLRGKKGIGKFFAKVANFFDRKALAFDRLVDPTTALPADLRQASANVKHAEAMVNRRLADEATIRSAFGPELKPVGKALEEVDGVVN